MHFFFVFFLFFFSIFFTVFIRDLIFSEKYIFFLKKRNHGQKTSKNCAKKAKYLKNANQIDDIIDHTGGSDDTQDLSDAEAAHRDIDTFMTK